MGARLSVICDHVMMCTNTEMLALKYYKSSNNDKIISYLSQILRTKGYNNRM